MDKTIIDLTMEPEFETQENPFLNEESEIYEIGHNYSLRSRIAYKLNIIKLKIQEMEHDLAIGIIGRSTTNK